AVRKNSLTKSVTDAEVTKHTIRIKKHVAAVAALESEVGNPNAAVCGCMIEFRSVVDAERRQRGATAGPRSTSVAEVDPDTGPFRGPVPEAAIPPRRIRHGVLLLCG
ncbi:unnamed protein product, partial [Boreogadus saida]